MKLRLPLALAAVLLACASSPAAEPWQGIPASYVTDGGTMTVELGDDRSLSIGMTADDTAIDVTGGGTFVLDGTTDDYFYLYIEASGQQKAILSDASLSFRNMDFFRMDGIYASSYDDLPAYNGGAIITEGSIDWTGINNNVRFDNNTLTYMFDENLGPMELAGAAVTAQGDIRFEGVGGVIVSGNSIEVDNTWLDTENDAAYRVVLLGGAIASLDGNVSVSDVSYQVTLSDNYLNNYFDQEDSAAGLTPQDLYSRLLGGAVYAGGNVEFSQLDSALAIERNAATTSLFSIYEEDPLAGTPISVEGLAAGGGVYAEGDMIFRDTSGISFEENEASVQTTLQRIKELDADIAASGGAVFAQGNVTMTGVGGIIDLTGNGAKIDLTAVPYVDTINGSIDAKYVGDASGGAIGAGGNISLNDVGSLRAESNSVTSHVMYTAGSDSELFPAGASINVNGTLSGRGAAMMANGDISFTNVMGGVFFNDNAINVSNQITFSLDGDATPVTIDHATFTLGGALYAGKRVVFDDVKSNISFTFNNITGYGSVQVSNGYVDDDMRPVVTQTVLNVAKGGGIYAEEGIVFQSIDAYIAFNQNNVAALGEINGWAGEGSVFYGESIGAGAGLASAGSIAFSNVKGDIDITENSADAHLIGGSYESEREEFYGRAYGYGAGIASDESIVFEHITGDIAIGCNMLNSSISIAHQDGADVDSMVVSLGGGAYAEDNLVYSDITGRVIIGHNSNMAETDMDAYAAGGGAYADRIVLNRVSSDILIEENYVQAQAYYWSGGDAFYSLNATALGGGLAASGSIDIIDYRGNIDVLNNIAYANNDGPSFNIATALGGGLYSDGTVSFASGRGRVLFEGNMANIYLCSDGGSIEGAAGGGAVAAMGGLVVGDPVFGDLTFRHNYAVASGSNCGGEDIAIDVAALGGALYLGGNSAVQNVIGRVVFENNYAIAGSCDETGLEALGGAVALAPGATALFYANKGDIIFRDNAAGTMNTCGLSINSKGGAIYVEGGDSPAAPDALTLAADSGYLVAFTGNKTNVVVEDIGGSFEIVGPRYRLNAIHMEKNAQIRFAGDGAVFFDANPITSGDEGGVSLLKTGNGTVYFYNCENIINGTGKGGDAVRVEGGDLHTSDGASLYAQGTASKMTVASGGTLSGGGIFRADGGFVLEGSIAPDSYVYTLESSIRRSASDSPYIATAGSSVGRLTLDGDASFSGGRLAHEIDMAAGTSDVLVITGSSSGQGYWAPIATNTAPLTEADLKKNIVVMEVLGETTPGAHIAGSMDVGVYKVGLANGANPNGDGIAWWTTYNGEYSSQVDVILNTAGSMNGAWFRQLDNLVKRMGDLRLTPDNYKRGDVWMRSYGQQSDIDLKIRGINDFREYQYGADIGIDEIRKINDRHRLATGLFAGYQRMERQFHDEYRSKGNTDSVAGGFYLTWLEQKGWYTDLVFKAQSFDNMGTIHGNQPSKFQYDTWGMGLSIETGRQFALKNSWFVEPMAQIAWLHMGSHNYSTSRGTGIEVKSSDAWQFTGMVRGGRNNYLGKQGDHILQTYAKVGVIEQVSNGGQVGIEGHSWRPNTDGTRGVAGIGAIWQYKRHQVHIDFEAGIGDKVDSPWGVNLGYRIAF